MRGFTLFTGGDGVGIAMKSLGVDVVGGIEYIDDIAQVARDNGMNVTTADILQCDPRDFPAMDWLHASPPCPNFSVAKSGATETENDFDLARKVAEWATVHKPRVFSLENVIAYRKSESWKLILNALHEAGYWVHVAHVNFADYGVPQTRKRMIARAVRGGFVPYLQPTHDKNGKEGLPRWIGWYEAIEDLIDDLDKHTVTTRVTKLYPGIMPLIAIVNSKDTGFSSSPKIVFAIFNPCFTVTVRHGVTGILIYKDGNHYRTTAKIQSRFQSFPDWYEFPESNTLATRIIGNAVPPVGMANVMRNLI